MSQAPSVPPASRSMPGHDLPLTGALSLLLPSEEQTLLLQSALLSKRQASAALESWQARFSDPVAAIGARNGGGRRLAPLIAARLGRNGGDVDPELLTYLRTALMREELRAREYRKICHGVLFSLAGAGLDVVALKGAVLSETVYPRPHLRHSHDIDVLIRRIDAGRTASLLAGLGFEPVRHGAIHGSSRHYVHESGLPLALHTDLFTVGPYNEAQVRMLERTERRTILDVQVRVLAPADQLLHVCVHAATGWQRSTLSWVCDAVFIMECATHLDWDTLLENATRARMSLPLCVMLRYLSEELAAPVPASSLERLRADAVKTDRVSREIALFGGWAGPGGKFPRAVRAPSTWRDRLFITGWRLAPSPASVEATGRISKRNAWPLWYLGRPFRFVAHRLRLFIKSDAGTSVDGEQSPAR